MRFPRLFVALIPFSMGCPPNTGGLGTTSDPTGDPATVGQGTATTQADLMTTAPGETEVATADGSGTGTSTGPGEGTTTAATTGPSESSSATGETGDPPPVGQAYGPCDEGACMGDGVVCYGGGGGGGGQMCLPPCDGSNPSCPPPPADNESLVECVEVQGVHCMLNCAAEGDASCPSGTTCVEVVGGIFRCLWP